MNSLMRKDPSGVVVREASTTGRRPAPTKDRESFDASNVLKVGAGSCGWQHVIGLWQYESDMYNQGDIVIIIHQWGI